MMLRRYILLLLLLSNCHASAQKMPEDYIKEAEEMQYHPDTSKQEEIRRGDSIALANYKYIIQKHPANKLCAQAYECIARLYERQGRQQELLALQRKILTVALVKKKITTDWQYNFSGAGHRAAYYLCNYQDSNRNYDSALYFLGIYDTVLPATNDWDGTGAGHNEMRYVDLYQKINHPRMAEGLLLAHSDMMGFYDLYGGEDTLRTLFKKYEDPIYLRREMEKAVHQYTLDTVWRNYDNKPDTSVYCTIWFLGVKICCSYRYLVMGRTDYDIGTPLPDLVEREVMIAYLKNTMLYKMIRQL